MPPTIAPIPKAIDIDFQDISLFYYADNANWTATEPVETIVATESEPVKNQVTNPNGRVINSWAGNRANDWDYMMI